MAKTKVVLNSAGIAELLKDVGVRAELHRRGEQVAEAARASAPVETGAYRDSIVVVDGESPSRAHVRIGATVQYAAVVELRTGNMARSLDAAAG